MFAALILLMFINAKMGLGALGGNLGLLVSGYFGNIHEIALLIKDYLEFYLFWRFAWSIVIGQLTSRFVGGLKTLHLLLALLITLSIPLAIWFSILYFYFANEISTTGMLYIVINIVGIYLACVVFILLNKARDVAAITPSPEENTLDAAKIDAVR